MSRSPETTAATQTAVFEVPLVTAADMRRAHKANSVRAWQRFDAEFRRRLTAYAYRMSNSVDSAHDLTQAAFCDWYRAITPEVPTVKDNVDIFRWLVNACKWTWIEEVRRRTRSEDHLTRLGGVEHSHHEESRLLMAIDYSQCVSQVRSDHKTMLERSLEGWTVEEIAREWGTARGNIGRWLLVTKQHVSQCLTLRGWNAEEIRETFR